MHKTSYRYDIDGLRAVAVLPVVLYHAGTGFSGGYVGVDVFFVISGFLITRLLVNDLEEGRFSMVDFWHRRVRRIFPALFAMVAVTLVVGALLMIPEDYKELGQSALAQCFIGSNFFFWSDTGYFATAAESKPLLHTWSLAVEEQFYLLFPLLLAALWRKGRVHAGRVLLVLLAVSLVASLFGPAWFPTTAFYLLPTRAWELMLGALLVFMPVMKIAKVVAWNAWGGLLGICGILIPACCYTHTTPFPGIAAVLPCVGTALVIWSGVVRMTWVHACLAWRPVVFVGQISYSLYLWHWPVLVFSRKFLMGEATANFVVLQLGLSFLLAVLSWRLVEAPFRSRRWLPERRSLFRFALISSVAVAICGGVISATKGLKLRLPAQVRTLLSDPPGLEYDVNLGISAADVAADRVPVLGAAESQTDSFVLWGDSHAMAFSPVLDVLAKQKGVRGRIISRLGTIPLLDTWRATAEKAAAVAFNQAALDYIRRHRVPVVLLVSYWTLNVEGGKDGGTHWLITDNEKARVTQENARLVFERRLGATVAAIRELGARVYILKQVPEQDIHVPDVLTTRILTGMPVEGLGVSLEGCKLRQANVNRIMDALGSKNAVLLDPVPALTGPDSRTILVHDGRATFADEGHLSIEGSMMLRCLLEPLLLECYDPTATRKPSAEQPQ